MWLRVPERFFERGYEMARKLVGARVCQMVLTSLDKPAVFPYGKRHSRYNDAQMVECAKAEKK